MILQFGAPRCENIAMSRARREVSGLPEIQRLPLSMQVVRAHSAWADIRRSRSRWRSVQPHDLTTVTESESCENTGPGLSRGTFEGFPRRSSLLPAPDPRYLRAFRSSVASCRSLTAMSTSPVPSPANTPNRIRRNTACTSCRDSKVKTAHRIASPFLVSS